MEDVLHPWQGQEGEDIVSPVEKFRLSDLDLDEISFVGSGDDPHAHMLIAKAAPEENRRPVVKIERPKSREDVGKSSTLTPSNSPEGRMTEEISKDDLPQEVVDYIEALEGTIDSLMEGDDDGDDGVDVGKSDPDVDEILKANPALQEIVKAANERAEAAEAIAKAERAERVRRDMISKADSLVMISDNKEDLATLLGALYEKAPEEAEQVEKLFRAADEQIRKSDLFKEIGKSSVGTSTSSVEGIAAELRKSDPTLSVEASIAKAYEQNPSLYDQALKEG